MKFRRSSRIASWLVLLTLAPFLITFGSPIHRRHKSDFGDILSRMNDAARRLKTVTADLDYTTFTAVVNDKSTESGQFFLRNPKKPEILIRFDKPDPKVILFKGTKAEIYFPKINRVQEYDLQRHSDLVQHFLLLGFGTDVADLKKSYDLSYVDEEDLEGETTAVLDLTPHDPGVSSQLTKVRIWISEDSWLPIQQKFFEPSGDNLVARYRDIKVNRALPASAFSIRPATSAERVKMN